MNPKNPESYDLILRTLKDGAAIGDLEFKSMPELMNVDLGVILASLVHIEYIQVYSIGNSVGVRYTITPKGQHFITNTSFSEQHAENQESQLYQKTLDAKNIKAANRSNIIAVGGIIVTFITCVITIKFANDSVNEKILIVNARVDSLNSLNANESLKNVRTIEKAIIPDTITSIEKNKKNSIPQK